MASFVNNHKKGTYQRKFFISPSHIWIYRKKGQCGLLLYLHKSHLWCWVHSDPYVPTDFFHSQNGFRDFMVPVAESLEDSWNILWLWVATSPAQTESLHLCNHFCKNSDGFYSFSSQMRHNCLDLTYTDPLKGNLSWFQACARGVL